MPTIFTKGDLFATPDLKAYAHGVTSSGAMDAGIALAFKKRWPRMDEDYRALCVDKRLHLGDVFPWSEGEITVYNLVIQVHWKSHAKLAALTRAVRRMVELATTAGVTRIGLPRIGTGMGGLDWPRVKSVLEAAGSASLLELVVFEQFIRAKAE